MTRKLKDPWFFRLFFPRNLWPHRLPVYPDIVLTEWITLINKRRIWKEKLKISSCCYQWHRHRIVTFNTRIPHLKRSWFWAWGKSFVTWAYDWAIWNLQYGVCYYIGFVCGNFSNPTRSKSFEISPALSHCVTIGMRQHWFNFFRFEIQLVS